VKAIALVMAGLDPAIPTIVASSARLSGMPAASAGMTMKMNFPGEQLV